MADVIYKVSVAGINESVKSLDDMDAVLKQLIKRFGELNIATQQGLRQDIAKEIQNISALKKQYSDWNQTLHNTSNTVNQAGMTLQGLNYVVRDSPYFFQNMNLGIMAVGNNINPLIDSFIRLRMQATQMSAETNTNVTAFGLLKQSLTGAGGVMLAFSLVVTAIQAFSFWQAKSKTATEDTTTALKEQRAELEKMTEIQLRGGIEASIRRARELEKQFPDTPFPVYDPETRKLVGQRQRTPEERFGRAFKEYQELDKIRQLYQKELNTLGDIENVQRRITLNTKQRAELNQDNYLTYVKEATSLKNAQDIMAGWIKRDQNLLKTDEETRKKKKKGLGEEADLLRDIENIEKRILEKKALSTWELEKQVDLIKQIGLNEFLGRQMGLAKETKKPEIELTKEETKAVQEQLQMINGIANTAGNSVANAFLTGKNAIDAATQALLQFITQLLVVQTIKGALNVLTGGVGGFLGGFMGFANGGIVQANNGLVVGGNSYAGDRILAGVNSGEMILNRTQQARLFKQINSGGGSQTIEVVGRLKADKNNFVAEVENAQKTYNKKIKVANIGRS